MLEGAMILAGGAMLLTPGLLTDITGFALIIPATRRKIRELIKVWLKKVVGNP